MTTASARSSDSKHSSRADRAASEQNCSLHLTAPAFVGKLGAAELSTALTHLLRPQIFVCVGEQVSSCNRRHRNRASPTSVVSKRLSPIDLVFSPFGAYIVYDCGKIRDRRRDQAIVLGEIRAKWGKFSEQDLSALNGNGDLATQLAAKYGLEKVQAQRDVETLMKGRQI